MIIIDYQTPKRVRFFREIEEILKKNCIKNMRFFRVTREYGETVEMMNYYNLTYGMIFKWEKDLMGKLKVYVDKLNLLIDFFKDDYNKIRGVITLADDALSRFAYGLSIPLLVFNDIPDAIITGRLSVPYATRLYVPFYVPVDFLKVNFGIEEEKIYRYHFLDPIIWLKSHKVAEKKEVAKYLNIDPKKKWIYVRVEPVFASYYISRKKAEYLSVRVAEKIAEYFKDEVVIIIHPRYNEKELFFHIEDRHKNIVIVKKMIDSISIVANSAMFIGGGGTINVEAAYYGVPVISLKPHLTFVEKFLIENGLTYRPSVFDEDTVFEKIVNILSNPLQSVRASVFKIMLENLNLELKKLAEDICAVIG